MPTYEYVCRTCDERLEAAQSFTDDALTTCPACGGDLRKLFGNVGIVFKGSGFYKTDSRSTASATKPASGGSADEHAGAAATADAASTSTSAATTTSAESKPSAAESTSSSSSTSSSDSSVAAAS